MVPMATVSMSERKTMENTRDFQGVANRVAKVAAKGTPQWGGGTGTPKEAPGKNKIHSDDISI